MSYNCDMKRTRGRPKKPENEKLSERLEVRASAPDKDLFQKAADRAGMELSDWIRDKLKEAAERENGKET